jgi:alkylhydroperoxidase/carboxymuconolactone decarboxylase family protein YurZ
MPSWPSTRPDRAPRDRSLVTVSALVASGQVAQMPYHLNRAMDNGLTRGGVGSADAPRLLYRVAERILGIAGGQGRVRETAQMNDLCEGIE